MRLEPNRQPPSIIAQIIDRNTAIITHNGDAPNHVKEKKHYQLYEFLPNRLYLIDDSPTPRIYELHRLKWNNELAKGHELSYPLWDIVFADITKTRS